ncbi:toxin [Streptomyces sp. NPDC048664]|uniref:toxin n=1 Tax=Streptomyces sp. NPDC048664 TaxID=3154505 RepID=UPI003447671F
MALDASDPSGLWLGLGDADYIVHEEWTSQRHQEHIIAHELGHMICGHRSAPQEGHLPILFPDLDPALVKDLLLRQDYSDAQERDAEIMAFLLEESMGIHDDTSLPAPSSLDPVVRRIQQSLARTDGLS